MCFPHKNVQYNYFLLFAQAKDDNSVYTLFAEVIS